LDNSKNEENKNLSNEFDPVSTLRAKFLDLNNYTYWPSESIEMTMKYERQQIHDLMTTNNFRKTRESTYDLFTPLFNFSEYSRMIPISFNIRYQKALHEYSRIQLIMALPPPENLQNYQHRERLNEMLWEEMLSASQGPD